MQSDQSFVRVKKPCFGLQSAPSEDSDQKANINLRWAHMYDGMFSAGTTELCSRILSLNVRKYII